MKYSKFIFILFTLVVFASCKGKTESKEGETTVTKKEEPHDEGGISKVSLTLEQMKTIGLVTDTIEMKNLTSSIKANGMLSVPNQNKAFVTPLFGGVVRSLHVQPGSYVRQGQTIAIIVNPDLIPIQQQLQQVNGQINLAELEYKRQKELVEGNAAPLKRLQQVQTELATLKSQRNGLQKQLATMGASQSMSSSIAVTAPISGTVSQVTAQLGSNVNVSTPIAEIVNNSLLHLDLYVYEQDLPKLKADQTIHFTLTNNPGKEYDAQIFSIGTAFVSESKTIPVHAKVMGDKTGLIEGMNITAIISLDKSLSPAVPTEAIVTLQGQDYIFMVVEHDEHTESKSTTDSSDHDSEEEGLSFEIVPVAKGTTDIGYTAITPLKPIPKGAKIVVKGAFFVLAKMTNSGEGEHGH